MGSEAGTRSRRVGEALREELSLVLATDVKDPGVRGVVVTGVDMTADLRAAKVRVRLLEGAGDKIREDGLLAALVRASGVIRREVTRRLGLRFAPELRFVYDHGLDETARIERLLAEIEAERRSR